MALSLENLKQRSADPNYKKSDTIICLCKPNEIDEYCNVIVCNYPYVKKMEFRHPGATHVPALLFSRLEELNISDTEICELPKCQSHIRRIIASNTKVDPHFLIQNYPYLEYCKTGYLECHPNSVNYPRRVYENAIEIADVRQFLRD